MTRFTAGLIMLTTALFAASCANNAAPVQTSRVKPSESPTPVYNPPKRVSRDVISSDTRDERRMIARKTK